MNKRFFGLVLCVLCLAGAVSALLAPPVEISSETFGGAYDDFGYSVKPAYNYEGVVIAGSYGVSDGTSRPYVIRPGWWDRTYFMGNGAAFDAVDAIWDQTCVPDHCSEPWRAGYIAVGRSVLTPPDGLGGADAFLARIWDEEHGADSSSHSAPYSGAGDDTFHSVLYNDGGYDIIAGSTNSLSTDGTSDGVLFNTTPIGYPLWKKFYKGAGQDYLYGVNLTSDDGYILCGHTVTTGSPFILGFAWLVRTDSQGNYLWNRTYSIGMFGSLTSVRQTSDGGYIAVGSSLLPPDGTQLILARFAAGGDLLWSKAFGGAQSDAGYTIDILPDGGYLIGGTTSSYGAGGADAWVLRTDAGGNLLWDKTFGGVLDDEGRGVIAHRGEYHLAGFTRSFSTHGGSDAWYVRMTPEIAGSVTVTSPDGGESWHTGTTHAVTWDQEGLSGSYVRIDLYKNRAFYRTIAPSVPAGDGYYSWKVPADLPAGSDYEVWITSLSNAAIYDYTNGWLTITTGPLITVTGPSEGQRILVGERQWITWEYAGDCGETVRVDLLKGGLLDTVLSGSTRIGSGGAGELAWDVPAEQEIGDDYTIRVKSNLDPAIQDESDDPFSVVPFLGVRVVAPDGGESWQRGKTYTIAWEYYSSPIATTAWIYLYKGGTLVLKIDETAPAGSDHHGSYSWTVPQSLADGSDYTVRVYTIPGGDGDESDSTFTISGQELAPLPGFTDPPTDPDGDGIREDLNANGRLDFADVILYFNQMSWIAANEPVAAFDLNGNGRIDFADIVALFNEV